MYRLLFLFVFVLSLNLGCDLFKKSKPETTQQSTTKASAQVDNTKTVYVAEPCRKIDKDCDVSKKAYEPYVPEGVKDCTPLRLTDGLPCEKDKSTRCYAKAGCKRVSDGKVLTSPIMISCQTQAEYLEMRKTCK